MNLPIGHFNFPFKVRLLDFIHECVEHFLILDTQVAHRYGGGAVLKPFGDHFKADGENRALDVAPGLAQGGAPVASRQVDLGGSGFESYLDFITVIACFHKTDEAAQIVRGVRRGSKKVQSDSIAICAAAGASGDHRRHW